MDNTIQMDKDKWRIVKTFFESEEKFYNSVSNAAIILKRVMDQKGHKNVIFSEDLKKMTGLDDSVLKTWMKEYKPRNKNLADVKVEKGIFIKKKL